MSTKVFHVDAFASGAFTGNPAAVCLLERAAPATWMQAFAAEMNLSETAFVVPRGDGLYGLRWFTPLVEIDLCGHATLATAHVLWREFGIKTETLCFETERCGVLTAQRDEQRIELDFPAAPATQASLPQDVLDALGVVKPHFIGRSRFDKFLVVDDEATLRALKPDFASLAKVDARGFIVTARARDARFDFVSRFFAPAAGVNEDPVTGSAHCTLAPYWSAVLSQSSLTGFQASSRGGVVRVHTRGDRVGLAGHAATVLTGIIAGAASPP